MAFLDNSGDIILDAVLTDTGRFRLAKGDGTFKIAKFAFGDDEINYQLYRNDNHPLKAHPSGSAYYDLEILQTPVLEAFTNNTSTLKTKLVTINKTNLLFMPVMKINDNIGSLTPLNQTAGQAKGMYVVSCDEKTWDEVFKGAGYAGIINGVHPSAQGTNIHIDQGLDTTEIPAIFSLDAELTENNYIIEIDNRLGKIIDAGAGSLAKVSFIDDDNIASYFVSKGTDPAYVNDDFDTQYGIDKEFDPSTGEAGVVNVVAGPKGTYLRFSIRPSLELQTSTNLFDKIGGTPYDWAADADKGVYFIDTSIRVTGATTGYRIDVPIRFVKYRTA